MKKIILKNGLTILHERVKNNNDGVYVEILFSAGSFNDPNGKHGLAHLTEHVLAGLNSEKYDSETKLKMYNILNLQMFGTSREEINIQSLIGAKKIPLLFDYIGNSIGRPNFSEEELEKEKIVIESEIVVQYARNLDTDSGIAFRQLYDNKRINAEPPYSFGIIEQVKSCTKEDVLEYIKNYLTLSNCTISVAGNISQKKLISSINKYFVPYLPVKSKIKPIVYKGVMFKPPMHIMLPSSQNGTSLINVIFQFAEFNHPDLYLDFKYKLITKILLDFTFKFFRSKNELCYYFNIEVYQSCRGQFLDIELRENDRLLPKVYEKLLEFIKLIKNFQIEEDKFDELLKNYIENSDLEISNLRSRALSMVAVNDRHERLYSPEQERKCLKRLSSFNYQEANQVISEMVNVQPYLIVISNSNENMSYQDFCRKIKELNS